MKSLTFSAAETAGLSPLSRKATAAAGIYAVRIMYGCRTYTAHMMPVLLTKPAIRCILDKILQVLLLLCDHAVSIKAAGI